MVAAGADVLVRSNRRGTWAWAGLRLFPVPPAGPEPWDPDDGDDGAPAAPLDPVREQDLVADAEAAWLAAQWTASGPARFEVRYRNLPETGLLECALLCRVQVATSSAAVLAAHADRDSLAANLPPHVRAEAIPDRALVRDWLDPIGAPPVGGQIEITKYLAWRPLGQSGAAAARRAHDPAVLVAPFSARRVSWEPVFRNLAELPFRAVLSVGFAPFNPTPAFRLRLAALAREYANLAAATDPDPLAATAAASFEAYVPKYTSAAFQARISLAAEAPLSDDFGDSLAALLSGPGPHAPERAIALRPTDAERPAAWTNLATLSAAWLPETYHRGLPGSALGAVERTLMTLIDIGEARSVLHLPYLPIGRPSLMDLGKPPESPA